MVILAVVVLVVVPGFFALRTYQGRASRSTYLEQARAASDAGRLDLALQYINAYLKIDPKNLDALDLKGKVLSRVAKEGTALEEAIRVENLILSQAPDRMDARRMLVELNLRAGLYRAAEAAAGEYLKRGATDAEAHRLMGRALEGVGYLGDSTALDRAIGEYEEAERLQPGDIGGASRLAELYRAKGKDPARAQGVMDSLLKYNPGSASVRLARFRFFLGGANLNEGLPRAMAEIAEALKLTPGDLDARLVAAEFAAQKGDTAEARLHLAAINPPPGDDLRVKLVRGMVELREQRTDEAIQSWRSGLIQTGGTDADLTWRLARVLLEMGRVRDAEPLMAQYRRLVGGTEPRPEYRYLVALMDLRLGRANEAIAELEQTRDKVDTNLAGQHLTTLGRAYEMVRDETKALDAYRRATALPSSGPQPWLAIARIQLVDRPADAITTLERGLAAIPDEPSLLVTLAQVLWQQEMAKPKNRRDWAEFGRWLDRAEKTAPTSAEVAAVKADYFASVDRLEEGLTLLRDATVRTPSAANLWLARANVLGRLDRGEEALEVLTAATKAAGENAGFRTAKASILLRRGEIKAARAVLVDGLDRVPAAGRPQLWRSLGELYQGQADFVAAKRAYEEWSRLQPDAPEPRLALLNLALAVGDIPAMEAQVAAMKATGGPNSLYWKMARAELLLQIKPRLTADAAAEDKARLDEAESLVNEIKATVPRQPSGHVLEGRLMERRNRPDDAILAYQAAIDLRGGQVALRPLVVLLTRERRTEALDALRNKVASFPPDLDRLSGALTLQMGDSDKAEEMARRMVQGDPRSLDAAVWKARVLNTLGKPAEAEESLKLMTQQRPEDPSPWLQLLMFQVTQKELPEARATVETMRRRVKTEHPEMLWAICYRVLGARDLADESYRAALSRWPDDVKVRQAVVDYYELSGRPDLAVPSLRHLLKIVPGFDWARRRLALNLSARPNDQVALEEALSLVSEGPKGEESPDDRLTRATVLSRSVDPANRVEAIRILESLAAQIPNSSKLHDVLARSLLATGQKSKARDHAAKAATGPDANADAILLHASLSVMEGDIAEADRQLVRLIAIDPDAMPTIELNARILHAKKDDTAAVALLRRSLDAHRTAPDRQAVGVGLLQLLLLLGLPDAAEELGKDVAQSGPKGQIAYAELLGSRGKVTEASAMLDKASKAGAANDAVRTAIILAADGVSPEWIDLTDRLLTPALINQPESIELLQTQAYLRHLQKNYAAEVKIYERILSLRPVNFLFMNNMAWTLSEELDRPQDGLRVIDEAITKVGRQAHLLDTRGVILLRLGKLDAAINDLEVAAIALPTPPVYFHLARAYQKAKKTAEFGKYKALAHDSGLRPDQLQPSEREEAKQLIGFGGVKPRQAQVP